MSRRRSMVYGVISCSKGGCLQLLGCPLWDLVEELQQNISDTINFKTKNSYRTLGSVFWKSQCTVTARKQLFCLQETSPDQNKTAVQYKVYTLRFVDLTESKRYSWVCFDTDLRHIHEMKIGSTQNNLLFFRSGWHSHTKKNQNQNQVSEYPYDLRSFDLAVKPTNWFTHSSVAFKPA